MQRERWSPYLTAMEGSPKVKSSQRSEAYSLSKERKSINQQLQLMKVRVKQLEREEKKAHLKALNASALTDTIIERRLERKKEQVLRYKIKQLKEQELEDLKERNREMKDDIRTRLIMKKEAILENKKISVKMMKEFQNQRKIQISQEIKGKSASTSPRPSAMLSKIEHTKNSLSRVDEEKGKTSEALKEMNQLQELESILIQKLKQAYEVQKSAEEKVTFLIKHPVIVSKEELEKSAGQSLSVSRQL